MYLEDESGRIQLMLPSPEEEGEEGQSDRDCAEKKKTTSALRLCERIVTGVTLALKGAVSEAGEFKVTE